MGAKYSYYVTLFLVLGLTASLTASTSLIGTTGSQSASAQPSSSAADSNGPEFLSFESQPPYTHRSAPEEWEPHQRQSNYTQEWWYVTAFLHDAKGNMYSLFFNNLKVDGEKTPFALFNPQLVSQLRPNQTMTMCWLGFSAYDSNHRMYIVNGMNDNKSDIWDAQNNAIKYNCEDIKGSWSFAGSNLDLLLNHKIFHLVLI